VDGYTPAAYIAYSQSPAHACACAAEAADIAAPPELCAALLADWHRLVDWADLVHQVGLDPDTPDMALLQCLYRWGAPRRARSCAAHSRVGAGRPAPSVRSLSLSRTQLPPHRCSSDAHAPPSFSLFHRRARRPLQAACR
jgi:hypothetical protein